MNLWTVEENIILNNHYSYLLKNELMMLLPKRSWNSILQRGSLLGYKRPKFNSKQSKMDILLDDSPLSYYWIGFILADGCFSGPNCSRLTISVAQKDELHIAKLSKFLQTEYTITARSGNRQNCCKIACQNEYVSQLIRNKFDIQQAKTYNPPRFLSSNDLELCIAMLAGLIDGDGNISIQSSGYAGIRIKCHSSWINFYSMLNNVIFNDRNTIKINNQGYLLYTIFRQTNISLLRTHLKQMDLPLLSRKWNFILD